MDMMQDIERVGRTARGAAGYMSKGLGNEPGTAILRGGLAASSTNRLLDLRHPGVCRRSIVPDESLNVRFVVPHKGLAVEPPVYLP